MNKARRLLGYKPKTGLGEGLTAEVDWPKESMSKRKNEEATF